MNLYKKLGGDVSALKGTSSAFADDAAIAAWAKQDAYAAYQFVITSYSIHYTKLYDLREGGGQGRVCNDGGCRSA